VKAAIKRRICLNWTLYQSRTYPPALAKHRTVGQLTVASMEGGQRPLFGLEPPSQAFTGDGMRDRKIFMDITAKRD
jgi:hypothetical protein